LSVRAGGFARAGVTQVAGLDGFMGLPEAARFGFDW
jgi:hypothetical protein